MTEASHQMTSNPLPQHGEHKPGSVGKATGFELAILDDNGKVLQPDEIGEVCIRGPGEKISPLEIDAVLMTHPAVSEAVAFAAPDEHFGEEVNAGIVLNKGAEADIVEHCKKNLAAFKIPKKIFFADELPRAATGKIQRIVAEHFLKTAACDRPLLCESKSNIIMEPTYL